MKATTAPLVAVVEDELPHYALIEATLARDCGFRCEHFASAGVFLARIARSPFDLVLLDWGLPDIEGVDVLRRLREGLHVRLPVIFVTARGDEDDLTQGLAAGADDYLVKPLQVRQLTARVGAVMRRYRVTESAAEELILARLRLDQRRRMAWVDDEEVVLSPREFELAWRLVAANGRLVARNEIVRLLWGAPGAVDTRSLDTHIYRLRRKLRLDPEHGLRLSSVYGHGYRLEVL
jgi:DNA-binding response OmpR family regulator